MRVIVLGDGLLGSEIIKQTGWDFISRKKDKIDITEPGTYLKYLEDYDVIVNCIAHTDTYSISKKDHWDINIKALDSLLNFCLSFNKKIIHISTDYLYTGSCENATEDDVPVHLNTWYGYSKLVGDALVQLKSDNYLICRLSHKPSPFPYDNAWVDIKTNCDYVDVIADIVIKLINKNAIGIYNIGTEEKSIYDLATKTKKVKPSFKPKHVPGNTTMSLEKLNLTLNNINHNKKKMRKLSEIYKKYKGDDGWGDKGTAHTYINEYAKLLEPYRENGDILEVGIKFGHSIKMWREYFKNGKVVGIDLFYFDELADLINDDRYKIIIADATLPEFTEHLGDLLFDVIIDDGSHKIEHQIATFNILKNYVKPGGLYIIEDIENIKKDKEQLKSLYHNSRIIDNIHINNRHDDVLVVYKFD